MTLGDHQAAFTRDIARLITQVNMWGLRLRFREVQRFPERQAQLLKSGATRTRFSPHLESRAADMVLDKAVFKDDDEGVPQFSRWQYQASSAAYQPLGEYWESLDEHNLWGGRFGREYGSSLVDGNHFERLKHPRRKPLAPSSSLTVHA